MAGRGRMRGESAGNGRAERGRLSDFRKATDKARSWDCAWPVAVWVGMRYALTGNSGRFRSHGGWRVSRIVRD